MSYMNVQGSATLSGDPVPLTHPGIAASNVVQVTTAFGVVGIPATYFVEHGNMFTTADRLKVGDMLTVQMPDVTRASSLYSLNRQRRAGLRVDKVEILESGFLYPMLLPTGASFTIHDPLLDPDLATQSSVCYCLFPGDDDPCTAAPLSIVVAYVDATA